MKNSIRLALITVYLFLMVLPSTAQVNGLQEMTVVLPAQSLAKVITSLLPYPIDLGENFIGSFFVQSIENIRVEKDRILFSSVISGKDIKYATKIGKQVINFVVGDMNLPNQWEVLYNYDKQKKILLVKPLVKSPTDTNAISQGDALLITLFEAFSGIEYPVELNNLKPVTSKIHKQLLTINTDIADVYGADNKLFIELVPKVQIDRLKED